MIKFNLDAKNELCAGINILANAVKCTLGPAGRNVLISNDGTPYITKDGVTVAKNVKLENPFEQLGATIIKNVASKTCDQAGDGTTTSTVLTQSIINQGIELITKGYNPILVKRGMELALNSIKENIKKQAKPIKNNDQLVDVATISANNDRFIGNLIGEAMKIVKNKGIITVDPSDSTETYVESVEGVQFANGFLSPYFINNKAKMIVELENPTILILKEKLKNLKDIMEELNKVVTNKSSILIITPDIESEVLNQLILNHVNGAIKCVVVKAPGFGEYQMDYIRDLSIITGDYEKPMYNLGTAEKVVINKETTTIINGKGNKQKIAEHITLLTAQYNNEPYEMNKLKIQERLAKLKGGAAIIHVGALSEVEMLEKKDRIDDALSATRAAIEEGVVIGGGWAYLNCLEDLTNLNYENQDEKLGIDIIINAIQTPYKTILENAGMEPEPHDVILGNKNNRGFNVRTCNYENLFESGIIDPAKVARTSIENAISVASMFLTTECCIINEFKPIEKDE